MRRVWLAGLGLATLITGCAGSAGRGAATVSAATATTTAIEATAPSGGASASPRGAGTVTPAPGGGVPARFEAMSVSFVSTDEGWVLGSAACGGTECIALVRTSDRGRSWSSVATPPSRPSRGPGDKGVRGVRFADARDGWLFGSELWSTHDGGAHWSSLHLPVSGPVFALETNGARVHAVAIDESAGSVQFRIMTASVGRDDWALAPLTLPVGAGPVASIELVLHGDAGWVLEDDRVVVAGARLAGGTWVSWQPPCMNTYGPADIAASSAADVVALCDEGVWGGGSAPAVRAYTSSDGGTSFARAPAAPPSYSGVVATPRRGAVVTTTSRSGGDIAFVATFDGGKSWQTVYTTTNPGQVGEVGFTTTDQGVIVAGGPTLFMTFDGGRHWSPVGL